MALPLCACNALFDDPQASGELTEPKVPAQPGGRFGWAPGTTPRAALDEGHAEHLPALAALSLTGVIDAHCHWFPENVMRRIWEYFDQHYWPITYRYDPAGRLDWLRRNKVKRFTTLNYAHRPGMASWLNQWTSEWAATVPEAVPCGTFFPEPGVEVYVRRAIEEYGFRGFKLHLRVGDMDPNDETLTEAFEQVAAAELPVIIHSGSAPDPGRFTQFALMERLVRRHPRLRVVVAHMGAYEFEDYLRLVEEHEFVHMDTTMVFVNYLACGDYPEPLLKRLERVYTKILFGSDYPGIPYSLSHAVLGVANLPFTVRARRAILAGNAARMFRLEMPEGAA